MRMSVSLNLLAALQALFLFLLCCVQFQYYRVFFFFFFCLFYYMSFYHVWLLFLRCLFSSERQKDLERREGGEELEK
jgi:hypothetical protein